MRLYSVYKTWKVTRLTYSRKSIQRHILATLEHLTTSSIPHTSTSTLQNLKMTTPTKITEHKTVRQQNDFGSNYWVHTSATELRVRVAHPLRCSRLLTYTSVLQPVEACSPVCKILRTTTWRLAGQDVSLEIPSQVFLPRYGVGMFLAIGDIDWYMLTCLRITGAWRLKIRPRQEFGFKLAYWNLLMLELGCCYIFLHT